MTYEPNKMKVVPFTGMRKVMEMAIKLENQGKNVIHFEVGQPDFDTPSHIKEAVKKALDDGYVRYTSNYGLMELREEISKKLKEYNYIDANPNGEIMVTVGGEEAVASILFALLDPGDEVLVTDPGYIPYYSLIKIANAKPVPVSLVESKDYDYDMEDLKSKITDKTKMLIVTSPNNPTGTVLSRENMLELAKICETHDLLVLSDEAYEKILYDGNEHISFATLPNMKKRTLTVQSFSKSYSMTGFRIGYIVSTEALLSIVVRVHQNIVLSAPAFAQMGAREAYKGDQSYLEDMVKEFDRRRQLFIEGFKEMGIPCASPGGAFYVFPDISSLGLDSWSFVRLLLEEYGVAAVPGSEFGRNGEGHIRISYANSYENCKEGIRRIKQAISDIRKSKVK